MTQKFASILDYPHPGLDPAVWGQDGKLLPEHRELILNLIKSYLTNEGLSVSEKWIKRIKIIGSLTTYQYTFDTDLDIHIDVNLPAFIQTNKPGLTEQQAHDYLDDFRKRINETTFLLPETQHPLELYFETPFVNPEGHTGSGQYNIATDTWEVPPVSVDKHFDIDEVKRSAIDAANEIAKELDISFGQVKQDIRRIEDLEYVSNNWTGEQKQIYERKIDERLQKIDSEIQELIRTRDQIVLDRRTYDPVGDPEVKFKYLQRFGYLFILSSLKELVKDDGEITRDELPEVKEIIQEASKKEEFPGAGKLMIDFDNTISDNSKVEYPEIGNPFPNVKKALDKFKADGWHIVIYSCRANDDSGVDDIRAFMKEHDLPFDEVFIGKPHAEYYIDDKNVVFTSWQDVLKEIGTNKKASASYTQGYCAEFAVALAEKLQQPVGVIRGHFYDDDDIEYNYQDAHAFVFISDTVGADIKGQRPISEMMQEAYWLEKPDEISAVKVSVDELEYSFGTLDYGIVEEARALISKEAAKGGNGYDYSSVQVNLPKDICTQVIEWGKKNIPDEDIYEGKGEDAEKYGREDRCHVTVLYGIHTNEFSDVEEHLKGAGIIKLKFGKIGFFSKEDKPYDVVMVEIDSKDLHKLNKALSDNLEFTNEFPKYEPHMTIAYVKKGKAKKYEGQTLLDGDITVEEVIFSPAKGKKEEVSLDKEAAGTHAPESTETSLEDGFIDPDGKFYPTEVHSHTSWAHTFFDTEYPELLEKGWIRVSVLPDELYFELRSINAKQMSVAEDLFYMHQTNPVVWDLGNKNTFEMTETDLIETGMSFFEYTTKRLRKKADFTPSISTPAPTNLWGPDDVVIPLDPDAVSEEETWENGEHADKPRERSWMKRILDWFSEPEEKEAAVVQEQKLDEHVSVKPHPEGGVIVALDDLELVPSYMDTWLSKNINHGDLVTLVDKHGTEMTLRYPFKNIQRLVRYKLYAPTASLRKVASAARGWLDPKGKFFEFGQFDYQSWKGETHDDWARNNETMLFKKYGIELDPDENPTYQLIENGWVRISDDFKRLGVHLQTLSHIPDFLEDALLENAPTATEIIFEDEQGRSAVIEDYSDGLQDAVNRDLSRERVQTAKKASVPFNYGGWISPDGEFVQARIHSEFVYNNPELFPGAVGADMYDSDELVDAAIKQGWVRVRFVDGDRTHRWAIVHAKSLDAARLAENFIYETLNDINSVVVYVGESEYSATADQFRELGWDSLMSGAQKQKVARLLLASQSFWVDPKGKVYPVTTHEEWAQRNREMLEHRYGIRVVEGVTDLLEDGWVRVNGLGQDFSIQVADLLNPPEALQLFLDEHYDWGSDTPILMDDLEDRYAEVDITGPVKDDIARAVRRGAPDKAADATPELAKRLKEQKPKHHTTWDEPRQTGIPFKPLPTTFEQTTNEDNLNWQYPWRFMKKPHGPNYSNNNEVNRMLMDVPLSKHHAKLRKAARSDFAAWIDPNGKIFNVRRRGEGGTHLGWVEDNADVLRREYRYEIPHSATSQIFMEIFEKLIQDGWVRVGDSLSRHVRVNIQLKDLRNIPSYVDDYLATFYEQGTVVEVEEGGTYNSQGRAVSLDNPFPTLQKAVNRALVSKLPLSSHMKRKAFSVVGLWVAPDGKSYDVRGMTGPNKTHAMWIQQNATLLKKYGIADAKKRDYFEVAREMLEKGWVKIGDTSRARGLVGVAVANIKNLPSYIDDALATFMTEGQPLIVADLSDNWAEVTWPFRSLQTEVRRTFNRRGSLKKKASTHGWLAPDGTLYEFYDMNHAGWVNQNRKMLKKKYGIEVGSAGFYPSVNSLVEHNWVRITGDLNDGFYVKDIRHIPSVLEDFFQEHTPDVFLDIIVEDITNESVRIEVEDALEKGLQSAINDELKRPSIPMAARIVARLSKIAVKQQDVADFYLMSLLPLDELSDKNLDPEHYNAFSIFQSIVSDLREEYIKRGMFELKDEAETTQWVKAIPEGEMPEQLKPYYTAHESGYSGNFSGDPDEEDEEEDYDYSCEKCNEGLWSDDTFVLQDSTYCEYCFDQTLQETLADEGMYCTDHHTFIVPKQILDDAPGVDNAEPMEDGTHNGHNLVKYNDGVDIDKDFQENQKKQLELPLGASKKWNLKKLADGSSYHGDPWWEAPDDFSDYSAKDFYVIFKYAPWKRQYGGPLWAEVARTVHEMQQTGDLQKLVVLIDHFHDLGHNTGKLLDKFPEWHQWFKYFLDQKAKKNSLNFLIQRASTPVRKLVTEYIRVHKPHWRDEEREDPAMAAGLSGRHTTKIAVGDVKNVLIVCSGNTCRSPMAESILRSIRPEWNIVSRGLYVPSGGGKMSPMVEQVLKEKGIPYGQHAATQLTEADVEHADIIFAMEAWQGDELLDVFPKSQGKVYLIDDLDVLDPIGGDLKEYQEVRDQLDQALRRISSSKVARGGRTTVSAPLYRTYWISTDGTIFDAGFAPGHWIIQNASDLGIDVSDYNTETLSHDELASKRVEYIRTLISQGWVKVQTGVGTVFITLRDLSNIPGVIEPHFKKFSPYKDIVVRDQAGEEVSLKSTEVKDSLAESVKRSRIYNSASTYTDKDMAEIITDQFADDLPGDRGPGNSYHDFPSNTTDYPKPKDTGRPKVLLDRLDNSPIPFPSYEVTWFMGQPRGDDTH
jgi:protein-tyrosine-phosphatase/2'-5' RNA ligase